MPCYSPITAWRGRRLNENGKRPLVFNPKDGFKDMEVQVPCGKCYGCRLEYSRQWAVRCVHEAQMHEDNCFITLTFNDDNLPKDLSIRKEHLQKFFKRLRRKLDREAEQNGTIPTRFKYFACGEYGESSHRPHYHAILFGYDFPDKELHTKRNGNLLFRSRSLEKLWPQGYSLIGDVSFESCAYVARYVMKKRKGDRDYVDPQTGLKNYEFYLLGDIETGEVHEVEPEFVLMSRGSGKTSDPDTWRYGIGRNWLNTFKSDTNKDFITLNGVKMKLPKYYDSVLEMEDELEFRKRKARRRTQAELRKEDNTFERLMVKEKVKKAQLSITTRDIV